MWNGVRYLLRLIVTCFSLVKTDAEFRMDYFNQNKVKSEILRKLTNGPEGELSYRVRCVGSHDEKPK